MKRKQLVVIYTNEYSTPIAAIFKQIASKRNCKGHTCKSEVFESLLLLPTPNCNCCQQKAQNLLQAVMKQNISHLVMYFPAWVFTFQFHFLAKTSPLNSLPAVTTKPAPIWQSFSTARSWSCTLLQITEPWIEQQSPIET